MTARPIVAILLSIGMLAGALPVSQAQAQVPKSAARPTPGAYLVPVAVGVIAGALLWPLVAPTAEAALGFGAAATPPAAGAAAATPAADAAAGSWWPSFLTMRTVVGGVIGGTLAYLRVR